MHSQQQHLQPLADTGFGTHHRLQVIARGANGHPRTYRLAPSSVQNAAYRRLAAAILGLDVATLADELRSARRPVRARTTSASIATRSLVQFPATASEAMSA